MKVVGVDERDSSWEDDRPRFRVYLHGSGPDATTGWTDTYDVTGADVLQVVDWAQRQAGGVLTYAIALVVDDRHEDRMNPGLGRGLVWLVGGDGNDVAETATEQDRQRRMLTRRAEPVGVPPADEAPAGTWMPYVDGSLSRRD